MPTSYKVLGQQAPATTVAQILYTVPTTPATETIISTITICNIGTAAATYRLYVRPNNATLANLHYIAYDVRIDGNSMQALTLGLTLDSSDVLYCYATFASGAVAFNAYGSEIS